MIEQWPKERLSDDVLKPQAREGLAFRRERRRALAKLALVYVILYTNSLASAAEESGNSLPQEVRKELDAQRDMLNRMSIEATETVEGIGATEFVAPTSYEATVEGAQFFVRIKSESLIAQKPTHLGLFSQHKHVLKLTHEASFDGTVLYCGTPKQLPTYNVPILEKYLVQDTNAPESLEELVNLPYFDAAGIFFPQRPAAMVNFVGLEPLLLHYLKDSKAESISNEDGKLRVESEVPDDYLAQVRRMDLEQYERKFKRIWPEAVLNEQIAMYRRLQGLPPKRKVSVLLDPEKGYAVIQREERTPNGDRLLRVAPSQWEYYKDPGIWLPKRSVVTYERSPISLEPFGSNGVKTVIHELKMVKFDSAKTVFGLLYTNPGTAVVDRTVPEARTQPDHKLAYRIPASESDLRRAAGSNRNRFLLVIVIFNCVLLAVFALSARRKHVA